MEIWILTLLSLLTISAVNAKSFMNRRQTFIDCSQLKGEPKCLNIKNCPSMFQLLNNAKGNRTIVRFLRRSACGYEGQIPKVCCPLNQNSQSDDPLPSSPKCGISSNPDFFKIVDGQPASLGSWPWMAALGYRPKRGNFKNTNWLCGGTLISDRHVVTAAHCLSHPSQLLFKIRLGDLDLNDTANDGASPEEFDIIKQTPHENYNSTVFVNDIAVLKLNRPVKFNSLIQPICLPRSAELRSQSFTQMNPFVAGWGDLFYDGPSSSHLQEVQIPVVPNSICAQALKPFRAVITDSHMCAGSITEGKDACKGDSGGPLMLPRGEAFYLIGVVSYGYKCAEIGYPGVYTRVTKYIDWITAQL